MNQAAREISPPLFGSETEYGLYVEDGVVQDLVDDAKSVVSSYTGGYCGRWLYDEEDPRRDMRGFRVDRLSINPTDAALDDPSKAFDPRHSERADHVLENGARLYNDHGHPEYSTPETTSIFDLVAHEKAGERIVWRCASDYAEKIGKKVKIYKNNTDFHGNSYGAHENYLISRAPSVENVAKTLIPFLATRIIYTGAGKVGAEPSAKGVKFQLSQRADFFTEELSVDTLYRRPIFNTRDEPHADPRRYRRLHVIAGDANMAEYAIALKTGAASAVGALIDIGWNPGKIQLAHPVNVMKAISRDESYKWIVPLQSGEHVSAVDVQRFYLEAVKSELGGLSEDIDWAAAQWERTLNALESDPMSLGNRLDWVAKKQLLTEFIEAQGDECSDEALRSIDLAYSDVDPEESLHAALLECGEMIRFIGEDRLELAMREAPNDARSRIRGEIIRRFSNNLAGVSWGKVVYRNQSGELVSIDLKNVLSSDIVEKITNQLETIGKIDDLLMT
jgi:proteasome accessory factor A